MKLINNLITNTRLKKTILISTAAILVGYFALYLYTLYRQEINIFPSNVGAQSFSVAWTTSKPTKGCIIAIPEKTITETKIICFSQDKSFVHLQSIQPTIPDTNYNIYHINGLRIARPKNKLVKTNAISDTQPPLPDPAYGTAINQYDARVNGALILLTTQSDTFSYPLATISNSKGTFTFDLNGFSYKADSYGLEATFDGHVWSNKVVSSLVTSPMPPITVTNNVE